MWECAGSIRLKEEMQQRPCDKSFDMHFRGWQMCQTHRCLLHFTACGYSILLCSKYLDVFLEARSWIGSFFSAGEGSGCYGEAPVNRQISLLGSRSSFDPVSCSLVFAGVVKHGRKEPECLESALRISSS